MVPDVSAFFCVACYPFFMHSEASGELPISPSRPAAKLTPLVANRAVLAYMLVSFALQWLLIAVLGLPIGVTLLISGATTLGLYALLFSGALCELRSSARWRTPPDWLTMLGALGLGLVASRALAVFLQAVWPASGQALQNYNLQFLAGGGVVWLILGGGLLIPFVEELTFRGFGLTSYEARRGPLFAALATSALFALVHGVPAQVIAVLPLGWIIARAVQFSGSFWTGVLIHASNNTLSFVLAAALTSMPGADKLLGESAQTRVSPTTGLVALAFAGAALWAATAWLKPRAQSARTGGPVWSWSLLVPLLYFALAASGERISELVSRLRPQ